MKRTLFISSLTCFRDSLESQLQLSQAKADSEHLSRALAEENIADLEKVKTVLELEIKDTKSRLQAEINKKELAIQEVQNM